ncbi:hypothetical protein [Bradyrhizobium australiense]|uniref:Uncharacterized protein n=1 Tax=Bradyrhizobium australiense TaxID=2721161 RepID=A0A7Y4GS21_9BRAD|nr:hypothetical protein [Bradyrhizobium australiense]NOJ40791.1 hypothetical protein [Bradyrhizobium australiense]
MSRRSDHRRQRIASPLPVTDTCPTREIHHAYPISFRSHPGPAPTLEHRGDGGSRGGGRWSFFLAYPAMAVTRDLQREAPQLFSEEVRAGFRALRKSI